ncbi:hypothetical protein CP973_26640 [Streptomyces albofaciens JCM 4342]|uniref:prenyltransferase/squalene oxidase repeat-containing protein n=1 Tax=Streptomyces albofaciens TaxID=66866 RepID=UPI00123A15C0|nr:prenyltransferase/squalene oxidase repeat-containing protein [Streptomyces albofaciens]KAA6212905.1 hypothetical protein CP973_26640 [Streptomyces albofaciens JCM 4342]
MNTPGKTDRTDAPDVPGPAPNRAQQIPAQLTGSGQVTASVYETARVVSLMPELEGHAERITYLLETQQPEGHWGPRHAGYALVPTLSATEALLTVRQHRPGDTRIMAAARAALRRLARLTVGELPDLPAADLIVGALVPRIERQLDDQDAVGPELRRLPAHLHDLIHRGGNRLATLTAQLANGAQLEGKLLHAAETLGEALRPDRVQPSAEGSIGASPAATAAWLAAGGSGSGGAAARHYLDRIVQENGAALPCAFPVTVLERAWALNWLLQAGVAVSVTEDVRRSLRSALGREGAATSPGLPADADTTSMVLATLTLLGEPRAPAPLLPYELSTHFCTWPGEQGRSVTTNAHVLEALGLYVRARPAETRRHAAAIRKVSSWLGDQQRACGSWEDRWHASPYYATFCATTALHRFGGPGTGKTAAKAMRWLLDTQHGDGSWGIWGGTQEETAYAVLVLTGLPDAEGPGHREAVRRAQTYLAQPAHHGEHPPLWHDKDLYAPTVVVEAALLAARHTLRRFAHTGER